MRFLLASMIILMCVQSGVSFSQEPNSDLTIDPETSLTIDPEVTEPMAAPVSEAMDVDVDTGTSASGAVDVDVYSLGDADTDASGIDETGSYDDAAASLPDLASEFPLIGIIGILCLFVAISLRLIARRREPRV
ncbi:MAG TPA: hypothetical protein VFR31_19800 [Thermoanaerobaculia bacterium]|nr:hypothetical protein [Thermoanaerobaculia bacterium]